MELKTIIIIFVVLLSLGGVAFIVSNSIGFQGKFTEASKFENIERACNDNFDNDNDGLVDCSDPNCDDEPCDVSGGCYCKNRQARETKCADEKDNDRDGLVDKKDPNCI